MVEAEWGVEGVTKMGYKHKRLNTESAFYVEEI